MQDKKEDFEFNGEVRVLVTGGSGFIGTNAVEWLLANKVNFINIDINEPQNKSHINYWKRVDIRNRGEFDSVIGDYKPTHILHLAAATGMDVSDISFFDANTVGVENLIDSANKVKEIKRILFTSSLLVCRNGYIPLNYDDYCPPNLYGKSKMIGEKIVKETKNPEWSWSIVRPTSIWGPYFQYSYRAFFNTINKGLYFHPGKTKILKPKSYVDNTVFMMFKILFSEREKVDRKTFYLSDFPYTSTIEWADTINEELGANNKIKYMPLSISKLLAFCGDILKSLGYKDPPITSFRLNNMLTGGIYPVDNTMEICGALPYSLRDGVRKTIYWLKVIGEIK